MKVQIIQRVVIEKVYDVESPTITEAFKAAQEEHSKYLDKVETDPSEAQELLYDYRDCWSVKYANPTISDHPVCCEEDPEDYEPEPPCAMTMAKAQRENDLCR